jgi:hypothetical protein
MIKGGSMRSSMPETFLAEAKPGKLPATRLLYQEVFLVSPERRNNSLSNISGFITEGFKMIE